MPASDPFNLERFVTAQGPVIEIAMAELAAGRKRSHWMWFVFPQIRGLGSSATAVHYAIGGLAEAAAYLAHPVLGPRLLECTRIVSGVKNRPAHEIFGEPDDLKFRSSLTLFHLAAPEEPAFRNALVVLRGATGSFDDCSGSAALGPLILGFEVLRLETAVFGRGMDPAMGGQVPPVGGFVR